MNNEELINLAKKIKLNALTDVTGYKVGAVLVAEDGQIFEGVNVEEKDIPNLSICAERNAFQNAFTQGERKFVKIAVVGGMGDKIDETVTPCGVCLQYMLDMSPDINIIAYINGKVEERKLKDFLMAPFILDEKK